MMGDNRKVPQFETAHFKKLHVLQITFVRANAKIRKFVLVLYVIQVEL